MIKIKLYDKAVWDCFNTSLSKQLAILQDQISNLINVDNPDPINISNIAANILTDKNMDIHNNLPEETFNIQLFIKQQHIHPLVSSCSRIYIMKS